MLYDLRGRPCLTLDGKMGRGSSAKSYSINKGATKKAADDEKGGQKWPKSSEVV